ncbi:hypothetical protein KI387_034886, partial [Taxus chinensis]
FGANRDFIPSSERYRSISDSLLAGILQGFELIAVLILYLHTNAAFAACSLPAYS